jgi:cysteine desulfurase / selenocysteine lyase
MSLKSQFPIFDNLTSQKPLVYLDSSATTQKPRSVIDAQNNFYTKECASSHSVHFLANQCSIAVENSRQTVANFLNANYNEIVFTSGTTESLNLLANCFLFNFLQKKELTSGLYFTNDSRILVSIAEHHSNLLPWQRLAQIVGCKLEYIELDQNGEIDKNDLQKKLSLNRSDCINLVCLHHISNVLGVINPIRELSDLAHQNKAFIIVDGTQAISHLTVDVKNLDVDFYCFSGHKVYAPLGIGILYGKLNLLNNLSNNNLGGEMVQEVKFASNIYKSIPWRLEAGTSNFGAIVGLSSAINWLQKNRTEIDRIEMELKDYLYKKLQKIPNLHILGTTNLTKKIPLFTCYLEDINSLDIAMELDLVGIAIRSGQHCTGLLHEYYKIDSSFRISLAPYNTISDIDFFVSNLVRIIEKFA